MYPDGKNKSKSEVSQLGQDDFSARDLSLQVFENNV